MTNSSWSPAPSAESARAATPHGAAVDLQTLLLVRRQSLDTINAAASARADALRARYRLLIDAQMLWELGTE